MKRSRQEAEHCKSKKIVEGSLRDANYPLADVQIEKMRLDMLIVDEQQRVIGRPWLTVGMDQYSGAIWGMHISLDWREQTCILETIKHGIAKKNVKEEYGTIEEWDIFGVPAAITLTGFITEKLLREIKELCNTKIIFMRFPLINGQIERFFYSLNEALFQKIKKADPFNEGFPRLTMPELTKTIVKYIVDDYHFTSRKTLSAGSSAPMDMYRNGISTFSSPVQVRRDEE